MTARLSRCRTIRPVPATAQPAGDEVQALARIRLAPRLSRDLFEQNLRAIPAVRSALRVTGDVDYEVRLACRNLIDLEAVLARLRGCEATEVVSTSLVLREVEGLNQLARAIPDWGMVPRPRQTRSA